MAEVRKKGALTLRKVVLEKMVMNNLALKYARGHMLLDGVPEHPWDDLDDLRTGLFELNGVDFEYPAPAVSQEEFQSAKGLTIADVFAWMFAGEKDFGNSGFVVDQPPRYLRMKRPHRRSRRKALKGRVRWV
jgi:hypothetical protein